MGHERRREADHWLTRHGRRVRRVPEDGFSRHGPARMRSACSHDAPVLEPNAAGAHLLGQTVRVIDDDDQRAPRALFQQRIL